MAAEEVAAHLTVVAVIAAVDSIPVVETVAGLIIVMEVSNVFSYCPMDARCVIIDTQRGCALDKGFSAPSIEYVFVGLKMSLQGKNRHPHCLSPIVR